MTARTWGPRAAGWPARMPAGLAVAAALGWAGTAVAASAPPPAAPLAGSVGPAMPAPDMLTVNQIVERNIAARGGLSAWRAVRSLSETGHMEVGLARPPGPRGKGARHATPATIATQPAPATQAPFSMLMKRPHMSQIQVQYHGATAIQTFDGEHGWTVMPSSHGPVSTPFPPGEARAMAAQNDLDGPLIDSAAKGTTVALDGVEPIDGRQTYRLRLTLRDGQVRHLWLDAQTFLETKIDGMRIIGGKPWPVETYFSAYRKVDGLAFPHALDTAVLGVKSTERIIIERIVLNPAIDDAVFAPPGVKGVTGVPGVARVSGVAGVSGVSGVSGVAGVKDVKDVTGVSVTSGTAARPVR